MRRPLLSPALLLLAAPVLTAAADVPGQKPLLIVEGAFRFVSGSWARYNLRDKAKQEDYSMQIAILDQIAKKDKKYWWMEISVEMPKNPEVVTRILVEETPDGPGDMADAIVQVAGYAPFTVPKKYYQAKDKQIVPPVPAHVVRRLEKKTFTRQGRSLAALEVEAQDADGNAVRAVVSEELPPIAVCTAETRDLAMDLVDWGGGARTRISGTPRSFYLWIFEQIGEGLSGKSK